MNDLKKKIITIKNKTFSFLKNNKELILQVLKLIIFTYVLYYILLSFVSIYGLATGIQELSDFWEVLIYFLSIIIIGFLFVFKYYQIELLFLLLVLIQFIF